MKRALIDLRDADVAAAGGKARGLARLIRAGLNVPAGVVLLDPWTAGPALQTWLAAAKRPTVAVRSSGREEDGVGASHAGQFESVLGVAGESAIAAAIQRCLDSPGSARALAYGAKPGRLAVIVQRMVEPRAAGVLFTTDPTGDPAAVIVEAVAGRGGALVSGAATPDRYMLDRAGQLRASRLQGGMPLLSLIELRMLLVEALRAEAAFGGPLDLEWAFDAGGELWWLQARPITARVQASLHEFDTVVDNPVAAFIRHNIGEVLPGALTPMTWDLVGRGIDGAMANTFVEIGAITRPREGDCVASFCGHAFLNLASTYRVAAALVGSSKESVDISLTGEVLPVPTPFVPPPMSRRIAHTARYMRWLGRAAEVADAYEAELERPSAPPPVDAAGWWLLLHDAPYRIRRAMRVHLHASMRSSSVGDTLRNIVTGGEPPTPQHHAEMAALLDADGDLTGTDLVHSLHRLCAEITADPASASDFCALDVDIALAWLRAGPVSTAFAELLAAHGHRGDRELELRAPDWSEDPRPLVAEIQRRVRAGVDEAGEPAPPITISGMRGVMARAMTPRVRQALALRERTKSLATAAVRTVKRELVGMARALVAEYRLPETDLVYFLTHIELSRLVDAPDPALVQLARQRRSVHHQQSQLEFPIISIGTPQPQSPAEVTQDSDIELKGTPVSGGVVRGPARVIRSLAEAAELCAGEILVVPHTDVGWTPCFSLAAGLATEIGGTLSHGAVVAREYGLPAIVDLQGATRVFRTGDLLLLDAERGTVRRLKPA